MEADGLAGDDRALWSKRRDSLNRLADEVADTYDRFIAVARDLRVIDLN